MKKSKSSIPSGISQDRLCCAVGIYGPQIAVTNTLKADFWLRAHVHCRLVGEALLIEITQDPADRAAAISNVAMEDLDTKWKFLH